LISRETVSGNFVPLLYLVPFIASGIYGLYLWIQNGLSSVLPTNAYLGVTRDPYVFIIGSLAVFLAVVLDVSSVDVARRGMKIKSISDDLQSLALACLVLSLICVFYANGFIHLTDTVTDFVVGRYSLVFPTVLVLLSYLITIKVNVDSLFSNKFISFVLLILSPAAVYELGRRNEAAGVGAGLALVIIGLLFYFRKSARSGQASEA
jgi:hypothetical protein